MTESVDRPNLDPQDYKDLVDSKVKMVYREYPANKEPVKVEMTGKLVSVGRNGFLIVPRGTQSGRVMLPFEVVSVTAVNTTTPLKTKAMAPVPRDRVRQHLLDRHGLAFETVESMSETDAVQVHTNLHGRKLSHSHE